MTPIIDVAVEEYASIVRIKPLTKAAIIWFGAHVGNSGPPPVNGWLIGDKGAPLAAMFEAMTDAGLNLVPLTPMFFWYALNLSAPKAEFFEANN